MLQDVKGPDLMLVIEVADSTLAFDLGPEAQLYASYGAQELWAVNARTRTTTVHTGPTATGWASVRRDCFHRPPTDCGVAGFDAEASRPAPGL